MRKVEQEMNHAVESKKEKERKISDSKKKIAEMGEVEFDEMAYDSYRKKIEELLPLKEEVAVLRNEITRLPDLERQIAELKKDVEMLEGMAEKLRAEILDLNFDKKRYEEIERQYEEKKGKVQHVREQRIRMQGEIKQIGAELTFLTASSIASILSILSILFFRSPGVLLERAFISFWRATSDVKKAS